MFKYMRLFERVLEKLPFQSYLLRLISFVVKPLIGQNTFAHHQQREYSLLDIFNSLGFLAVIISLIILYDQSFNEFKVIIAFNPLFFVFSWVLNAIIFSVVSAGIFTSLRFWLNQKISLKGKLLSLTSKRINEEVERDFYNLLTHGFRCYAAFGLFLGIPFVKVVGSIFLEGQVVVADVLGAWYWQLYLLLTVIGGVIWLVFYPYVQYCKLGKNKFISTFIVFLVLVISLQPIKFLAIDYKDKLDGVVLCDLFKKSDFLKRIPKEFKEQATMDMCQAS